MNENEFRKVLSLIVLTPVVCLGMLAIVLGVAIVELKRSAQWVDHTDQVISQGNLLLQLLADEASSSRGNMISGDEAFLRNYRLAAARVPEELLELKKLVADRDYQEARAVRMERDYQDWKRTSDEMIARGRGADVAGLLSEQGEKLDGIRGEMREFLAEEERLRAQRWEESSAAGRFVIPLLAAVAVAAALVIGRTMVTSFRKVDRAFRGQLREIQSQHDLIHEREQWLGTTLRSIGDGVIVCDDAGRISFMNMVSQELTGWEEAEAKGRPLAEVFRILNEYTREVVESPVDKVRRLGKVVGLANHTVLVRKDGGEISIDDSGAPVRDTAGKLAGVVLVFRDNGEKRIAERSLIQAEKLAAAGRLAATVAHEVNNPLEALINLVYLGKHHTDPEEMRETFAMAETQLNRIAHITRQTLGFYRESTAAARFRPLDLVQEVVSFYGPLASQRNIQIEAKLRGAGEIVAPLGELRQVVSNLVANSMDAIGREGRIRIAVRDETAAGNGGGRRVRISVADTGGGIAPEIRTRLFEPFFTTKVVGTGLGLWVSRELVEKHGGRLQVRSRAGVGTVFSMILPAADAAETESGLGKTA